MRSIGATGAVFATLLRSGGLKGLYILPFVKVVRVEDVFGTQNASLRMGRDLSETPKHMTLFYRLGYYLSPDGKQGGFVSLGKICSCYILSNAEQCSERENGRSKSDAFTTSRCFMGKISPGRHPTLPRHRHSGKLRFADRCRFGGDSYSTRHSI